MSTADAERDCCQKTRVEWERKIALYYSSFLFIPAALFALMLPELPGAPAIVEPLE